ncbi:Gfo/Idh/MocA family oxidoreductase [Tessaracoccus sp. MC1865]|uniref:Gfo/Idh/MocA family protein n=1 Tax=Tessaracoccus sp. MC1865 TaxID=2760310 RepID=UPI0016036C3B|nr:Gfo/Idh/MocA family oxidoreductase [Tessaracoccus sp. MC1865]MBB1482917.1 Gfo/Idh/MocA family oxidoreductase [Tessaracoccus sp. MC1865]QTO37644.1 Gfo/Idh/MocA family oxidoreductase [Tessaracoccus sp. MC1865]
MSAKTRVGVIGAGSWALASHLPNLARRDDVEFVAVNRRGEDALKRVQRAYGFAHAHTEWQDVLDHDIDVVVISSPTSFHVEQGVAALERGIHVLMEKPVAIDSQSAWRLAEASERTGRHVVVAFGWNFKPMIRQAKRLMTEHGIGEVEAVSLHMSSQTRELLSNTGAYPDASKDLLPQNETWTDPSISGGGYAQAQLSHALGLQLWLTDMRVDGAFARMTAPLSAPVELHDAVTLRYEGGAIGTMFGGSNHVGAGNNKHQLNFFAIGSEGQLRVDVEREQVWLFRSDGFEANLPLTDKDGAYDCIGPVDTVIELAQGGHVENCAPAWLGARTVEALELAYASAGSGHFEERK